MKRNLNICIHCKEFNRSLSYCNLVHQMTEKQSKEHFNDRDIPEKCVMKLEYDVMLQELDKKEEDKKDDNSFLKLLEGLLTSQINANSKQEIWTKINYDITDEDDGGKMVNVTSHKVAFYFDKDGKLKGIHTWK